MAEKTVRLHVPMAWASDHLGEDVRPSDAERYASLLADALLADTVDDISVVYDVVDHSGYGDKPTAGDYDLTHLAEAAFTTFCRS